MSGILALVSNSHQAVSPELARAYIDAIAHRGDQRPRLWLRDKVALGHVNLPTTSEAEREQLPASDPSGRFWLTWDGRLDFRETLGDNLDISRENARRLTDADLVLAAYAKWGDTCV